AALLVATGLAGGYWYEQVQERRANDQYGQFLAAANRLTPELLDAPDLGTGLQVRAANLLQRAAEPVAAYRVVDNANWQADATVSRLSPDARTTLRDRMGEYLVLLTQAVLDASTDDNGRLQDALVYSERAAACFPSDAPPRLWARQRTE